MSAKNIYLVEKGFFSINPKNREEFNYLLGYVDPRLKVPIIKPKVYVKQELLSER